MTSTTPKPDTGPVVWDDDYRAFIWRIMERLEREQAMVWDLRERVKVFERQVAELQRRVR
jgi:uncharacterized protein (UPF0335 family)